MHDEQYAKGGLGPQRYDPDDAVCSGVVNIAPVGTATLGAIFTLCRDISISERSERAVVFPIRDRGRRQPHASENRSR
jgi:hypothetical protein